MGKKNGAHGQCPSFAFLCSLDLKSPLILCESKPPDSLHFSLAGRLRMHVKRDAKWQMFFYHFS